MPRTARVVYPGVAHHVTQRGNNRQDVFFVPSDRHFYLNLLKTHSQRYGLSIHAFCLMTNHVHLVAVPTREDSLARTLGRTHTVYARYVNELHGRSGHLWQARFYSCMLDDAHYWAAMCYAEMNPVRAGLVRRASDYPWSSASAHVSGQDPLGLLDMSGWSRRPERDEWAGQLCSGLGADTVRALRGGTRTGRPLGSDSFLSHLEARLGRRLRALRVGRPRTNVTREDRNGC